MTDASDRIGELEDHLKEAERRIADLRRERDEAQALIQRQDEHVRSCDELVERWIGAFDMVLNDRGAWEFKVDRDGSAYNELLSEYNELVRKWNKFVPRFNVVVAARDIGRPLAASEAQQREVLRLKSGASLRAIANATSLGLRTVRTIVEKQHGEDRTGKRRQKLRRWELDRARMATWRGQLRLRNALPKQITDMLWSGKELIRQAKD